MDGHLDIFGQQPFFTINTQLCFFFPLIHASSDAAIIDTLTKGLERLNAGFPWLACEIINEGSCEGNTGVYKFKALAEAPRLVVKDLSRDASAPNMDSLRKANFPMCMIDENIVAPRKTFPGGANSEPAPVFLIQATFISGGLILTFVAQHNTMDMTGQAHIIHLFSKACRGEQFTSEDLVSGNLPRQHIVPLLDPSYTPGPELDRYILKAGPSDIASDSVSPAPPKCTWAYLHFSASSLASLKLLALEAVSPPAYISTDDAITAFIWQAVIRARLPRLNPATRSTIARAVNVRQYLNIPQTYPGPIQVSAYSTFTLKTLAEEPLGIIALQLRSAVDPKTSNLGFHTRAIATFLSRTPNKAIFSSTADFDLSVDLILSSWAKVQVYQLDFNLGLGRPEAVRRPRFQLVEGLFFLMPQTPSGDIAVAACLRDEDMERLKADTEFAKYGEYIG